MQHIVECRARVVREPVTVLGSSRTDAGVHARGQVAAFSTTRDIPVEKLPRAVPRAAWGRHRDESRDRPEGFDPSATPSPRVIAIASRIRARPIGARSIATS